ncbi:MAG TPA: DsrE family protein [Candidatus Nitrosocosmicus sp.]|jgi:sulfur relay (sulfurtransferase) complex TusBCD TusD component (DsrE family)|nr:DsrE family protein [Candidatus Nitrosocosmicus sp.]
MQYAGKKLGLMLSTGPENGNLDTAVGLSEAALDRGAQVYLYLIDDGVAAVDHPRVQALAERGARLFVCAFGCQKRGLPLSERATNCGLVVLTDVINGTDRFVALN